MKITSPLCRRLFAALIILSCSAAVVAEKEEIVLIHGASHGAWCWYKVQAILQQKGYKTTAIDLLSNGKDRTDPNTVASISQYAKPLTDYLATVSGKVVLVGHSLGGVSLSYAAETYPDKISKLVYVTAVALLNNQSTLDTLPPGIVQSLAQIGALEVDGPAASPTSFRLSPNISIASQFFYNQSPLEDVFLASSLLTYTPFAVLTEKLSLSLAKYGSVPRYYVIAGNDNLLDKETYQKARIAAVSFTAFYELPKSDHSPFFSEPKALSNVLVHIERL